MLEMLTVPLLMYIISVVVKIHLPDVFHLT